MDWKLKEWKKIPSLILYIDCDQYNILDTFLKLISLVSVFFLMTATAHSDYWKILKVPTWLTAYFYSSGVVNMIIIPS